MDIRLNWTCRIEKFRDLSHTSVFRCNSCGKDSESRKEKQQTGLIAFTEPHPIYTKVRKFTHFTAGTGRFYPFKTGT